MIEIRMHGRGGQGTVLAAAMLAKALVAEGRHAVAVPSFGFERRGAPVAAFLRVDDKAIRRMTNIYEPHCVLCIDPTVGRAVNVFEGLQPGGTLVQTTARGLGDLQLPDTVGRVGLCDAVALAMDIFRRPITNTLMLGAFARTTGLVSVEALEEAVRGAEFRDAGLTQNLEAVRRGFEATTVHELTHAEAA